MNSTRLRSLLLAALLAVALGATGCSQSKPQAAENDATAPAAASASESLGPAKYVSTVDGFPLDRSLGNLVKMRDVDTIVVIEGAAIGEPAWVGSPGVIRPDAPGEEIVTPVDASVSRVFRGAAVAGDPILMVLRGGRIGEYEAVASTEVSAKPEDLAKYSRFVVAGETITSETFGQILNPFFVYGIAADGRATSLLESAGQVRNPNFSLTALRDAELAR